jgi:uncharacterized membrane protein
VLFGVQRKVGVDEEFERSVRDLVTPGTSALFLIVDKVTPDKAIEALSRFGGTVLKSSFSRDAERELQEALHGGSAVGGGSAAGQGSGEGSAAGRGAAS